MKPFESIKQAAMWRELYGHEAFSFVLADGSRHQFWFGFQHSVGPVVDVFPALADELSGRLSRGENYSLSAEMYRVQRATQ